MSEHRYLHSAEKDEAELERLTLQASIIDPVTIRHLETIGVAEGWKCLEVGAGAGSIAHWLSTHVGPEGRVVATDINTRFLDRIRSANLEVRRHDILKDDLEVGHYDLVHCRMLLQHLAHPEKALTRMADAVRPAGWLLIEETDYGSAYSADVTDPSLTPYTMMLRAFFDSLRKRGIADYYTGRRVRGLVEGLGFLDVSQEGWTCIIRGGDPLAHNLAATLPAMFATGVLSQEQRETIQHRLQDQNLYRPTFTLFCAWGRKPVQGGGT